MKFDYGLEIIGEIGVNHNGETRRALALLDVIKQSGAQTAKIQLFQPDLIVSPSAPLADYQRNNGVDAKSQIDMLRNLTLSEKQVAVISEHASDLGLGLLITPFDLSSLRLIREMGHNRVKIGSGDLTFHHLVFEASLTFREVILSTGMSNFGEVKKATNIVAAGFAKRDGIFAAGFLPNSQNLKDSEFEIEFTNLADRGLTLMHCTSTYPAPIDELNMTALSQLASLGTKLGYSDHSLSSIGAIIAVGLGARVFEKHITLDKNEKGPDHAASLNPVEFSEYVRTLQEAFYSLGTGEKLPQPSEQNVRKLARRSLFASKDIRKGENFTQDNLASLRPEGPVSADHFFDLLGEVAKFDFNQGDSIEI